MENKIYKICIFLVTLLLMGALAGCEKEQEDGVAVVISYIGSQSNKIIEKEACLKTGTTEEQLEEMLTMLSTAPAKLEYQVPLSQGIRVITTNLTNGALVLNLTREYKQLNPTMEILTRASLVKSITQLEGIDSVAIHIEGEPFRDSLDKAVGNMTADMFIDNAGEEISTYEKITVRLYFANEAGDGLIAVDRSKAYNTNISLDKFVMEELLKGPGTTIQGVYPTINPDTKLISTLVKDNTCYVNLDNTFLTQVYDIDAKVAIYSIVNSLCEVSGIDRVQISVDGKTDVMFQEVVSLKTVFARNLDYIQNNVK